MPTAGVASARISGGVPGSAGSRRAVRGSQGSGPWHQCATGHSRRSVKRGNIGTNLFYHRALGFTELGFRMALLPILKYPDARLHKIAAPVGQVDDRIRQLVRDMAETMYAAPGVGLAATQVDVHERVVVIDVSEEANALHVLINPEI